MKCLILAGGAGNRMWPISRKNYPKQFVFLDGKHSIFQETITRNMSFCDEFWVISSKNYKNIVEGQLSYFQGLKYRCFYEPESKKTAPALLFACMCANPEEQFLVVSCDSLFSSEEYKEVIVKGRELIEQGYLVCIGARTAFPTLGIGLLSADEKKEGKVIYTYPENREEINRLTASADVYWDTGVLMGTAGTFIQEFKANSMELYSQIKNVYDRMVRCENINRNEVIIRPQDYEKVDEVSIASALTHKTEKMRLVTGEFECNRIISLDNLGQLGRYIDDSMNIMEKCNNVSITNLSEKKVVAVNDLDDIVVVNTDDAVYISRKDETDNIKGIIEKHNSEKYKNVFEEKTQYYTTWGYKETLHMDSNYWIRRITLYPGRKIKRHYHERRAENWTVVSGVASVFLDGNRFELTPGNTVHIESGRSHELSNRGEEDLVVIETAVGVLSDNFDDSDTLLIENREAEDDIIAMEPCCKEIIWGGLKLRDIYGKKTDGDNIAESWEISAHPSGQSVLATGKYKGIQFGEYLKIKGKDILGWKSSHYDRFPLLVKFIDAKDNLSVQVHPDDDYALVNENQYGKNEMWYVMEAEPGACLYCGFNSVVSKAEIERRIKNNTLTEILNRIEVHPGETYFIPAGTVHAIGEGVLICEIQQNSDVTYRLYDYGRRDKNGNERQLHIRQGLEVLNPSEISFDSPEIKDLSGGKVICNCKYFTVTKYEITESATIWGSESTFTLLIATKGEGRVKVNGTELKFRAGLSFFIPANACAIQIEGNAEILTARI